MLIWLLVLTPVVVPAESRVTDDLTWQLIGTWKSIDLPRITTKIFGDDGSYRESYNFLGARVTITGTYRIEANRLWWTNRRLFIDRRGGDVRPPTRHARLNEEQSATIEWKSADMFAIRSDRPDRYRRARP